jgi:hypothetical protein
VEEQADLGPVDVVLAQKILRVLIALAGYCSDCVECLGAAVGVRRLSVSRYKVVALTVVCVRVGL